MRLKDLKTCYVYLPISTKEYGETSLKWSLRGSYPLNVQQDISELDRTSTGLIDYDRVKLRSDFDYGIEKNDGISFEELELDDNGYAKTPPKFRVLSDPRVGKSITYTCDIYHGEWWKLH